MALIMCTNLADLPGRDDIHLKANLAAAALVGPKYDGVPAEDLVELAVGRLAHLGVTSIATPDDRYTAIAVLEGLKGNPRRGY